MTTQKNHLKNEKSPYLLQHADNPVNWFPWGDEAFAKAKRENKPIFLSIGYSTCHWCHVMAHESFEDDEVAEVLNNHYVSIKVDREERPDIDSVYMKVCQMMTEQGGWPLTIIMTPDKVPFYAGTYFPKESKYGMPGLIEMLSQIHKKYVQDPDHINEVTENVQVAIKQTNHLKSEKKLDSRVLQQAFEQLKQNFDVTYGGFGDSPKFPQPQNLLFLLDYTHFTNNKIALTMVEKALHQMAKGGIFDQIGFGFSRYSTDHAWLIPHFEKMLYDNALLLTVYTNCYQITGNPFFKKISEQIICFITREMTSNTGAFYSAIDADSERVEGKYYVWDYEEIFDLLGENVGELFAEAYGLTPTGNFEGKNIPNRLHSNIKDIASGHNLTVEQLHEQLEKARVTLLEVREKRIYPHVDDKILTSWNGMMIAALAKAGNVFVNDTYTNMARRASQFIEENLVQGDRLMARYRDGETKFKGYLDDYAYLIWAFVELYETTFELSYLSKAIKRMNQMIDLFWDEENGGFFQTGFDSEKLISREKEVFDGALPSGNGVAANMLMRLSSLTGNLAYSEKLDEMFYSFYEEINEYAPAAIYFVKSLFYNEHPTKEVVIIGANNDPNRQRFLEKLQSTFLPNVTLLVAERPEEFNEIAPFAAEYKQLGDETTIYVCENFACKKPTTDIEEAIKNIVN